MNALEDELSADHTSPGDTEDLAKAIEREIETHLLSSEIFGHQPQSNFQ